MQMKKTTGYAIRIILELSRRGTVTIEQMASILNVEGTYAQKILRKMRKAGYVKAINGKGGGYELVRKEEKMNLWDIMEMMEESTAINRCLEKDHYCSKNATENCAVRRIYNEIQEELEKEFRAITIEELMKEEKRL